MAREGVATERAPIKAELEGIRSTAKASVGARRVAVSELWFSERSAGPSCKTPQSARPRRAGESDHAMCWLSQASARRMRPLNLGWRAREGLNLGPTVNQGNAK